MFEPWRTSRPADATGVGTVVTSALDLVYDEPVIPAARASALWRAAPEIAHARAQTCAGASS